MTTYFVSTKYLTLGLLCLALFGCGPQVINYSGQGSLATLMNARNHCLRSSQVKLQQVDILGTLADAIWEMSSPEDARDPPLKEFRQEINKLPYPASATCSRSAFKTCLATKGYIQNRSGNLSIPKSARVNCQAP